MFVRSLFFWVSVAILTGCSAGAYAPVVVSAHSVGAKQSLINEKPYSELIGQNLDVTLAEQNAPSLRKFRNGRYFIDFLSHSSAGIEHICDLKGGSIRFHEIYKDTINGGIKFDATVICPDGKSAYTPINHWSDVYIKLAR